MAKAPPKFASAFSALPGRLKESESERPKAPLTLMLLGKTGNGKSSLGNALLQMKDPETAPFQHKDGFVSCQDYDPIIEEGKILEHKVSIIDTPGVLDNVDIDQALEGICRAIFLCPSGVTAFVIVLRASRFTKEESEAVTQLQSLFGDRFWQHAICVFTHGDAILKGGGRKAFDDKIKKAREQLPNFDKLMASVGNRVMLVNCNEIGPNELTEFVLLLDSIRNKNNGESYTNTLFQEAQLCFERKKGAELMASLRRDKSELRELEAEQSKEEQEEIAKLKEQISAQEVRIKTLQDAELTASLRRDKSELRELEAEQSKKEQKQISKLKEQISAQEVRIKTLQDEVAKAIKRATQKKCTFL